MDGKMRVSSSKCSWSFLFLLLSAACGVAQDAAKPQDAAPSVTLRNTVEDWSVLTLDKSELKMRTPNLGEVDREATYTRERWQVQWRDMDPIDLYVIRPVGVERPPVIFYLYSYEIASKRPFINDGWCQRVTSEGYAAIGFVPALTEDRFQMRPMKQWFLSEFQEALGATTHDVQLILNYLQERGDFDLTRVGVFGTGSGATVGILAAAADPRIRALDLVNPWADWPVWLKTTPILSPVDRKDYVTPEFMAKVAPLDPVRWLPTLSDRHVRIQVIDEQVKQEKESLEVLEQAAPGQARVVHYATVAEHKTANDKGRSFEWVKAQLKPQTPLLPQNSARAESSAPTAKP
jgi:hypothetical protein